MNPPDTYTSASSVMCLMISDIKAKAEWVYGSVSFKNVMKALFTDGTFAMITYRKMQWAQRWRLVPLAMMFNKMNSFFGRCIIGRGAQFGPGFVLIHSYGTIINSAVRCGANVKLEHSVTIGAEKGEIPVLGDNVFVGAGAKILGGVRIGNNVKIGANAVVTKDIPDNSTAVGIPAEVIDGVGERR